MKKSEVAIVKGENVESKLREAILLLGGIKSIVRPGDKVFINPNWVFPAPPPVTTSPKLVKAMVALVKEANPSEILIGDSSAWRGKSAYGLKIWSTKDVFEQKKVYSSVWGMHKAGIEYDSVGSYDDIKRLGAKLIDLDEYESKEVWIKEALVLKKAMIFKPVLDADVIISMPVLKTHMATLVSLGIKNFHGILDDTYKMKFHRTDLSQKLVDIHKFVKANLTVIDGTKGIEGFGPVDMGNYIELDLIIAGKDTVAVDAVATEIMGFKAFEVETTRIAHSQGVGLGDLKEIKILGRNIEEVRHPFKGPDIRIAGIFPGIDVIKGGACLNCLARTRQFLDMLQEADLLRKLNIGTVLVGVLPRVPDVLELNGRVLTVGNCALKDVNWLVQQLGDRVICLDGCPPSFSLYGTFDKLRDKYLSSNR